MGSAYGAGPTALHDGMGGCHRDFFFHSLNATLRARVGVFISLTLNLAIGPEDTP